MAAKNWGEASGATKAASIGMALSAILSLIIGFAIIDELPIPIPGLGEIAVVYVLLFFAIDFIVAIGLFLVKRWARRFTIYWAVLSVLSVASAFVQGVGFSVWFIPNILTLISGILLLGGKDFKKESA